MYVEDDDLRDDGGNVEVYHDGGRRALASDVVGIINMPYASQRDIHG